MDTASHSTPTTLDDSAPPAEVRAYFAAILSQQYHIPDAEAEQLVQSWRYGTGAVVKSFGVDAYRGIFGPEIGTLLYKHLFPRPLDRLTYCLQARDQKDAPKSDIAFLYRKLSPTRGAESG